MEITRVQDFKKTIGQSLATLESALAAYSTEGIAKCRISPEGCCSVPYGSSVAFMSLPELTFTQLTTVLSEMEDKTLPVVVMLILNVPEPAIQVAMYFMIENNEEMTIKQTKLNKIY